MGPPGLGRRQGEWAGCKTAVWVLNETGVPPFTPGDIYFLGSQTLMVGPEWASDSNKYFSVYLIFLFISFWYWHKWDPWFNSRSMICIITLLTASHKLHPDQWHISGQSVQSLSCVWLFVTPGSSVHGISQARILEWVAISFSRRSSPPRDQTCISCLADRLFTTEPLQVTLRK